MPDTETGQAFDAYGRRVKFGRDRSGALYLDFGSHLYLFEDGERDKLREGIDRAAMPGQVTARVWPCCKCCQLEQEMTGAVCVPPHHLTACASGCDSGQVAS